MARWRIRKCCQKCGKWELVDKQNRYRVVARRDSHAAAIAAMDIRDWAERLRAHV